MVAATMSLLKGLSATSILDGLPHDEQLRVVAGKYDHLFPALRTAYVLAVVDEMARAILANVLAFQQCTDIHWPRAEESWHLIDDSGITH